MKHFIRQSLCILYFLIGGSLVAQTSLKLDLSTIDSTSAINGQVDIDVKLRDFENLIASQFTITWDSTVLEITEIPFISADLPGLNVASFALPAQTLSEQRGRLAHAWLSGDALPKSLPDGHLLFTMRFKAVGQACSTTDFSLLRTQNYQTEVSNNDLVNIGAELNGIPILITGTGCEEFSENIACNSLQTLSISPWQSETGISAEDILVGGPYDYNVMQVSPSSFDCSNLGDRIGVTVTHTPSSNSCWGEVIVVDEFGPTLSFVEDYTVKLTSGSAPQPYSARVQTSDLIEQVFDNCSDSNAISFEPSFFDFDCSKLGDHIISVTAIDEQGNQTTLSTTVHLELSQNVTIMCPGNVVVDCGTDIHDSQVIENVLGAAASTSGCVPIYTDTQGYDQNQDGDEDDMYQLNGVSIAEDYIAACEYGTIRRVWSMPGSSGTCIQIIGLEDLGSSFDGETMIDWPYSLDAIVSVSDNDAGNCVSGCNLIERDSIELVYDNDGKPVGANIVIDCPGALCEEPFWQSSSCSLIGWASETQIFDLPEGGQNIVKTYFVIDACQFDTTTMEGRWSWEVNALIRNPQVEDVVLSLPDLNAERGQTACLALTVQNFQEIQSFQGSINWDPSIVQYSDVKDFGIFDMNAGNFGTSSANQGQLSFSWFDSSTISPVNISDGDTLFTVCFNVVGTQGSSSLIGLSDIPTFIEIGSEGVVLDYVLDQGSISVGAADCSSDTINPVSYCLGSELTAQLENGSVDINAIDFNIGSFDNCTDADQLRYTFTSTAPEFDPDFDTRSSRRTFTIADIPFPNTPIPLDIYVWDESGNNDFCTVSLILLEEDNGPGVVELYFEDYAGPKEAELCVPLRVNNFTDVEAFQGTISWDPEILEFSGSGNYVLSGFNEANINNGNAEAGVLPFVWIDLTAQNPTSLPDGTGVFEICFKLIGDENSSSVLDLISSPALVQLSSSSLGVRNHVVIPGSVNILDSTCNFGATDIFWPDPEIRVNAVGSEQEVYNQLLPGNLILNFGLDSSVIYPVIGVPSDCSNVYGITFTDTRIILPPAQLKIVRDWTVLNWLTAHAYSFRQEIYNYLELGNICDTLPNSAPVGDCGSGHSLDDDVEWPDDLSIADHRISPDELVHFSSVDFADSRPEFFNIPELYTAHYSDILDELNQNTLVLIRQWLISRVDYPEYTWTYDQRIEVDFSGFSKLVTVNTHGLRPLPGVMLSPGVLTDDEGKASTEENLFPEKTDEPVNGLNVLDMVLMRGHILGMWTLNTIQQQAADLSESNNVTTLDLVLLENILLSKDTTLSRNWVFIDSTRSLAGAVGPRAHYVAYKPGDVDDSANIGLQSPSLETSTLMVQEIVLNAGETYSIPMFITENFEAVASEIHLSIDANKVNILDVYTEQSFDTVRFNVIKGNRLSILSNNVDLSPEWLDSETPLFVIEIEALENGTLQNVFGLSDKRESYLLYRDYTLVRIENLFEGEISTSVNTIEESGFVVYPNPANDFIQFVKPADCRCAEFSIDFYDINGCLILQENQDWKVDLSPLNPGTYMYRIKTDDILVGGRFVKIK